MKPEAINPNHGEDRVGERLLEDELAPAVLGSISRRRRADDQDLERLTGSSIGGTVESFTATMQRG